MADIGKRIRNAREGIDRIKLALHEQFDAFVGEHARHDGTRLQVGVDAFDLGGVLLRLEHAGDHRAQVAHEPVVQAIDPAVHSHFLAAGPRILQDRGQGHVANLFDDVDFTQYIFLLLW